MNTAKFTVSTAKNLHAKLVKVANDMLDVAAAPAPEPGAEASAGTAGPQEVVDALEVVIDELEQVSEAIPAEPSNAGPEVVEPAVEDPTGEPQVEEPVADPAVEEEEPKLAKQVKDLTAQLDAINRKDVATLYAELFNEPKVQQAKFDEVIASKESTKLWTAKINSIEQYKQNEGASTTKIAKAAENMTSWISRSKFAKQDNGLMNL